MQPTGAHSPCPPASSTQHRAGTCSQARGVLGARAGRGCDLCQPVAATGALTLTRAGILCAEKRPICSSKLSKRAKPLRGATTGGKPASRRQPRGRATTHPDRPAASCPACLSAGPTDARPRGGGGLNSGSGFPKSMREPLRNVNTAEECLGDLLPDRSSHEKHGWLQSTKYYLLLSKNKSCPLPVAGLPSIDLLSIVESY